MSTGEDFSEQWW